MAALAVALTVALGFAVHHFWTGRPRTVAVPPPLAQSAPGAHTAAVPRPLPGPTISAPAADARLYVDVVGKVRRPGLRRLPSGSRVADALSAAGGALPGTDTSPLNLARVLVDGEQIVVGAPAPPGTAGTGAPQSSGAAAGRAVTGSGGAGAAAPISLSTATQEQLDALPGVGPVLAQRILDYRSRHDGFTSVAQLRNVSGIGERRFADLAPLVRP